MATREGGPIDWEPYVVAQAFAQESTAIDKPDIKWLATC